MSIDSSLPRSRRTILTGAVGALAGAAAATLSGAQRVFAAGDDGSVIHVGDNYADVQSTTTLTNATNSKPVFVAAGHGTGPGLMGTSPDSYGVSGVSQTSVGVDGLSGAGVGVHGLSSTAAGVYGYSYNGEGTVGSSNAGIGVAGFSNMANGVEGRAANAVGVAGYSNFGPGLYGETKSSTAVVGYSSTGNGLPANPPTTGVYGFADKDAGAVGVRGRSPTGRGGVFNGTLAQIRLGPSGASSHPASGQAGDFFVDKSHRLWFCKGGTSWKQVA